MLKTVKHIALLVTMVAGMQIPAFAAVKIRGVDIASNTITPTNLAFTPVISSDTLQPGTTLYVSSMSVDTGGLRVNALVSATSYLITDANGYVQFPDGSRMTTAVSTSAAVLDTANTFTKHNTFSGGVTASSLTVNGETTMKGTLHAAGISATTLSGNGSGITGITQGQISGALSSTSTVPPGLIDLSTVTTAIGTRAQAMGSACAGGNFLTQITASGFTCVTPSGYLSNTTTVPPGLIDLSTVTTALNGKLSATGPLSGSIITNFFASTDTLKSAQLGANTWTAHQTINAGITVKSTITANASTAGIFVRADTDPFLTLQPNNTGGGGNLYLNDENGVNKWRLWDLGSTLSNKLALYKAGNSLHTVFDQGGRVGINTLTPNAMLEVNGPIHSSATITAATMSVSGHYYGDGSLLTGVISSTAVIVSSITSIQTLFVDAKDPTGFLDSTTSSITFSGSTFQIAGTNFPIYINGVKQLKSTATLSIPTAASQLNWIYYDLDGTLTQSPSFPGFYYPTVATVYYSTSMSSGILSNERHTVSMPWRVHEWAHDTIGSRYASGLSWTYGTIGASVVVTTMTAGEIYDDDQEIQIPQTNRFLVLYHNNSSDWSWNASTTSYYTTIAGNTGRAYWNNGNTLVQAAGNVWLAYWIYAGSGPDTPLYVVTAQRTDTSLANAQANATPPVISGFPMAELRLLYRVIIRSNNGPVTLAGVDDYRDVTSLPASGVTPTAHSSLSGLDLLTAGHPYDVANGFASFDLLSSTWSNLNNRTAVLEGNVSTTVFTTGSYANPSWITSLSTSKIDLSTVTAALAGKQDTGNYITSLTGSVTATGPGAAAATIVSVPTTAVNLSTVTSALAGKLSNASTVPPTLIDLSTVTTALAGKLSTTVTVPPSLIDLSTVTTALAGKLSTSGPIPGSIITNFMASTDTISGSRISSFFASTDALKSAQLNGNNRWIGQQRFAASTYVDADSYLSGILNLRTSLTDNSTWFIYNNAGTLTFNPAAYPASNITFGPALGNISASGDIATAGKFTGSGLGLTSVPSSSLSGGVSPLLINLSTVTTALAGKLSTTVTVPPSLIDLSTVTTALAGKLAKAGDTMTGQLTVQSSMTATSFISGSRFDILGSTVISVAGGSGSTFVGLNAGNSSTGIGNTFVGNQSGAANTTGAGNVFVGGGATNITGYYDTYIGAGSGNLSTGNNNVFVGYQAGYVNTGADNVMLGSSAGDANTGSGNILIGKGIDTAAAGDSNVLNIGGAITGNLSTKDVTVVGNLTAAAYYGDGSHLSNLPAGGVSVSTFTEAIGKSGGDVYVSSGPFISNTGMYKIVDHSTITITGVRCWVFNTSSVDATTFNIARSTDTGSTSGYSYLFNTAISVAANAKWSDWKAPDNNATYTTLPYFLSVHTITVPASGVGSEYGCEMRYWRGL